MKFVFTIFGAAFVHVSLFCQSFPEFSPLSGRTIGYLSSAKVGDRYYYLVEFDQIKIYEIDASGTITDSIALANRKGNITAIQNRLFFHGLRWNSSQFSMRQIFTEYGSELDTIKETSGAVIQPFHGQFTFMKTPTFTTTYSGNFNFYRDTLFSFEKYLVFDTPQVVLGATNIYTKTGIDGQVYEQRPLNINALHNCFFVNNRLFVQGSGGGFLDAKALLEFDSKGNIVRSMDYDSYDSGGYFDGASGGWHRGRFYFSYVGKDPNVPGCSTQTAAIDVRDSTWKVLYRFKLPDCGYEISGKMPFCFDIENNVYYAAPHKSLKKVIVYKFSPDFRIIWKKELEFNDLSALYFPVSQWLTEDGGLLLNCINRAGYTLHIFKISSDGNVVSSIRLPGGISSATGPLAFPNPTTGPLTLAPEYAAATQAQLSTIDGRHLGFVPLQDQQIDLSAQPAGVYTLTLWDMKARKMLGAQMIVKE